MKTKTELLEDTERRQSIELLELQEIGKEIVKTLGNYQTVINDELTNDFDLTSALNKTLRSLDLLKQRYTEHRQAYYAQLTLLRTLKTLE